MNNIRQKRYRVAQWGTGNIGMRSLQAVIEHPQLDLVGVYVYSDAKAGRDAGALCCNGTTGIIATKNIDDILAARPDCVLYMPDRADIDVICRLLESGSNIVTTRAEFHHPDGLERSVRQRVEAACVLGGTSVHSTGSSPGFASEVLPFAFALMQRRLDCVTMEEFADMSSRNSPEMLFDGLGFGRDLESLDRTVQEASTSSAAGSMRMVAAALSLPIDDVTASVEFAVARDRVEIAAGSIEVGTVAARRSEVTGMRHGRPLYRKRATYYVSRDIDPAWDLRDTGWHFLVEGDTPLDVHISFPVPEAEYAAFSPRLTAHPPVNAVPYVCEAPPGIQTSADLPVIIANLGP